MGQEIQHALAEQTFDLVITSQWQMTAYRHLFAHLPALFEELEVGLPYNQVQNAAFGAARWRAQLTWWKQRRYLNRLLSGGQPCTVVSEQERDLLSSFARHSPIHVVPNGVSLDDYANLRETPQPNTLIFTGSFRYRPNFDAMVWFIEEVLPRIQAKVPDVTITITGHSADLLLPYNQAVLQTGFVEDVRPLIARSWISVAPLLAGGGTRFKILEAFATGTPVVATSKGAEGLIGPTNRYMLIADDPNDFAEKVIRLLADRDLRDQLSQLGRRLVEEQYEWKVILPTFLNVVKLAGTVRQANSDQFPSTSQE
jgi:glycosyltransferase involved in cell wall biosynthesis